MLLFSFFLSSLQQPCVQFVQFHVALEYRQVLTYFDSPSTSTGVLGSASLTLSPLSLYNARTLPVTPPMVTNEPTVNFSDLTRTDVIGPRCLSKKASMVTALANHHMLF